MSSIVEVMAHNEKILEDMSDADLEREIERRKKVAAEERKQKRKESRMFALEHKDVLIKLMKHSRNSCEKSPNHYYNKHGEAECQLCCLKELEEWDDVEVMIDIRLVRHED